jgi:predicted nucleotide-binding protein (sugar kinase/HSP70/actin superfamily)
MNRPIGGLVLQALGESVLYKKQGVHGVIELYPLTCMPEIMACSIMHKVSEDHNIPILTLCFDERTGEAGLHTRLEAFVDMIKRKNTVLDSVK